MTSIMLPLLEVEDVPGTTSWKVTLRDQGLKVGQTRYFDGPNAEHDANKFVEKVLHAVQEANESAIIL